jgi:predicted lipoprotein with Yx(FWY)xxD motif
MGTDSVRAGMAGAQPRRPAREHERQVNRPLGLIATRSPRGLSRSHRLSLRAAGAGLLAATGAIHLDLYLTGYRTIPTIGWLFLVQIIMAFLLAAAVLALDSRIVAAAGAGFAVATLGGYLLTVWVGLFGFTEVRTTAGIAAGIIEVAAFAALAVLAMAPAAHPQPPGPAAAGHGVLARLRAGVPGAGWAAAVASIAALVVLGVSVAQAGGSPPAAAGSLQIAHIAGATVLTNAKGFTLYLFDPDTASASNCNGSCAAYWPPVTGIPTAGPGVTGRLGTIARSDGSTQATYNGHPLYTYIGDTRPGQANGNNLNLNGGLWHEVTASGAPHP